MLALCRRHRLPAPLVNEVVEGHERDFVWPEQRLIVETDGWQATAPQAPSSRPAPRRRPARAGWRPAVTWKRLTSEPARGGGSAAAADLARRIQQHLAAGAPPLQVLMCPAHVRQRVGLAHLRPQLAARQPARTGRPTAPPPSRAGPGNASARSPQRRGSCASAARSRACSARAMRSRRPRSGRRARAPRRIGENTRPPDISRTTSTWSPSLASTNAAVRSSTDGIDHGVGTQRHRQRALLLGRGRGDHPPRAERLGQLHCQRSHAAGAGDHHHRLARGELGRGLHRCHAVRPWISRASAAPSSSPSGIGWTIACGATAYSA